MSDPTKRDHTGQTSLWRKWLGVGHRGQSDASGASPATDGPHHTAARAEWLPVKYKLLGKITDFIVDHDLDVVPFTLGVAYDCISGGNPPLTQSIGERTDKGLPVTIQWLEQAGGERSSDHDAEALATMMNRLEETLEEFGSTMTGARTATTEYNSALRRHADDLQQVSKAGLVISELATLTRAMIERTRVIENELAISERRAKEFQRCLEETRLLAEQDHLTGLPNRRAFEYMLEREIRETRAGGGQLIVAFCDIDHFKRINDTHGHPAGDRVLKFVAETLGAIADARCHVARHGGEEFAVLFRDCTVQQAWQRLDAARAKIAERRLVNRADDTPFGPVTFSGGIADVFAYPTKSDALKAADLALYAAKQNGRNCIVKAGEPSEPIGKPPEPGPIPAPTK